MFNNPVGIGKSITPVVPVLTNDQHREEFIRTDCADYGCGETIDEIEKCSVSNITTLDFPAKQWKCSKFYSKECIVLCSTLIYLIIRMFRDAGTNNFISL